MLRTLDVRSLFAEGLAHHQAGRLEEAVSCYRQALALRPDQAAAHNNLATALCDLGRLEDAEASYRQALALQPNRAEAHNNLGTLLYDRDRLNEAVVCYRAALALEPDYPEALCNLGAALYRQGKLDEAEASIRHALALKPDFAGAHDILGTLLADHGRLDEAAAVYRRFLRISPRNTDALSGLAIVLQAQGQAAAALETILNSLRILETAKARRIFADIVGQLRWTKDNPEIRRMMVRALAETWARPGELARSSASLVKQGARTGAVVARAAQAWPRPLSALELFGPRGAEALADDELLRALLISAQNTDIELERFLTMARRLLMEAAAGGAAEEAGLEFHAALARQCFINDYVFFHGDQEIQQAATLLEALAASLKAGTSIHSLRLLAVAAYFPLGSVSGACRLLDMSWPEPVAAVLAQQLREPELEAQLRAAIPQATPIADKLTRLVQAQYEENPYPRWLRIPRAEKPISIAAYLRRKLPFAAFQAPGGGEVAEILSAGCGTGQLALEIVAGIKARVLAVDLSRSSLGYAARKAGELGLSGIEFAQADLLALGDIGRRFDVVECCGVLHHLADPFAGWRLLLSLLRPGGFMALGLYSEAARADIVAARRFIAERGYGPSAHDIRRCRQELLDLDGEERGVASSGDFFGVSSCRDLLFHAQEHRLRLGAIAAFLRDNNLTFLGFETANATLQAYRRRFPADPGATNLNHWQAFEADNPDTFSGMYMFWIQKPCAAEAADPGGPVGARIGKGQ